MEKHQITSRDVPLIVDWLKHRGGVLVWKSINLSNPGASWTTPALQADGAPAVRPSWEAANEPARHITDPAEIEVIALREVKRFRVALRRGSQGLSIKLTDASSARLRRELEKAGDQATYQFDYCSQEAVISVPGEIHPLEVA